MSIVRRLAVTGALLGAVVAPVGPAHAAAQPSDQDQHYLRAAHQSNLAEIAIGQLAQQRGTTPVVRELGEWFATDHSQFDSELQEVAAELPGMILPYTPNPNQQAVYSHLLGAYGEEFDTLFVYTQLGGHAIAMHTAETQVREGADARVIQLAAGAQPFIASHHEALLSAAMLTPPPPSGR
jgi:putative membrane protein